MVCRHPLRDDIQTHRFVLHIIVVIFPLQRKGSCVTFDGQIEIAGGS